MAVNSINTNIAAYYAQANIGLASRLASASVARLSSGNRIVLAADDVAALAAGTSLASSVLGLRAGLLNASQGTSLLQVADGGAANIINILQRQKAIAQQAGSGSLQDTDRAFLNQEFQALSAQIDQIATNTTFNGVTLLDGSIAGSATLATNTSTSGTGFSANQASLNSTTAAIITFANAAPADGDTVTINGVTVTFTTAAAGTTSAVGKVTVGSSATNTAQNLVAFLNSSGDPRFANLSFTASSGAVSVAYTGGSLGDTITVTATASVTTSANVTVANGTIGQQLTALGIGINRVSASGAVTGSILSNASTAAANNGGPFDFTNVSRNAAWLGGFGTGEIGQFTGLVTGSNTGVLSIQVGDITYRTASSTLVNSSSTSLTFTGYDSNGVTAGGTFSLNIRGDVFTAFDAQSELDPFIDQINSAMAGVTFYQNRDVASFENGAIVTNGGVQVGNLQGLSFDLRSSNFDNVQIGDVRITSPGVGQTDAVIEVEINGEVYRSISGIGSSIGKTKIIALVNENDPRQVLTMVTGTTAIASSSTVTLDLTTQAGADAIAAALKSAFGADDTSGLDFQIGTGVTDKLGVTLGSARTSVLFGGLSLDVLTQQTAAVASAAISDAIATATSLRANIGALESRFAYASANLQSTIQNQDAARSELLDTDVASESTSFATNQVKLQAGISVLAQANQQLQALLKLIG